MKQKSYWMQSRRDEIMQQNPIGGYLYLLEMEFGKHDWRDKLNWWAAGLPRWAETALVLVVAYGLLVIATVTPFELLNHFAPHIYGQIYGYGLLALYLILTVIRFIKEYKGDNRTSKR